MVWWSEYPDARPVKGARTLDRECETCNNTAPHMLYRVKSGIGFGNPLTGRVWASTRTEWLLVCSVCEMAYLASKDEAKQLQEGGLPTTSRLSGGGDQRADTCSSCGTQVGTDANFCGTCGHRTQVT